MTTNQPNPNERNDDSRLEGPLSSLDKDERYLVQQADKRLTLEGLREFRRQVLDSFGRQETEALNAFIERTSSILTTVIEKLDLSEDQIGIASAYSNFMREFGKIDSAKRVENMQASSRATKALIRLISEGEILRQEIDLESARERRKNFQFLTDIPGIE